MASGPCARHAPAYNETCPECLFSLLVAARAERDAIGHALGVCYDHDHGCGGAGPLDAMLRAIEEGNRAKGERIDAEAEGRDLRAQVAAVLADVEGAIADRKRLGCPDSTIADFDTVATWLTLALAGRYAPERLTKGKR